MGPREIPKTLNKINKNIASDDDVDDGEMDLSPRGGGAPGGLWTCSTDTPVFPSDKHYLLS